ncbi:DUF1492 domain-containing protein [Eubacteriales bacterium OttesenSCG-928-A19]|nr:DUF1492 domain-containing protein [Eubacteriales bacterium OttesenSCG-928-A19]
MTAKEFLSQAYMIDQRINSKLEQAEALRSLAEKATSVLSPWQHKIMRDNHAREDVIIKLLDLEEDITRDIDELVDTKRKIMEVVACVPTTEYRTLLELRYICCKTWKEIAGEMFYADRYIHTVHSAALQEVDNLLPTEAK